MMDWEKQGWICEFVIGSVWVEELIIVATGRIKKNNVPVLFLFWCWVKVSHDKGRSLPLILSVTLLTKYPDLIR